MKTGDRLTVIHGEYAGFTGVMTGLQSDGRVIVRFGDRWDASFSPHDVDLAPLTLWNLLVTPLHVERAAWLRRRDTVRAKHERVGGPDEQQLAEWWRTS